MPRDYIIKMCKYFYKHSKLYIENLIVASALFIDHFLTHYLVLRYFYIIYLKLLELKNQTVIAKYVQTVNEAPLIDYPHYPPLATYFLIILTGVAALITLFNILARPIEFILTKVHKCKPKNDEANFISLILCKCKPKNDEANFISLILSYLIIYFSIDFTLTESMLVAWADYAELFIELLLISTNFIVKGLDFYIRRKFPLNLQQIQYYQQYIGKLLTLFMQGLFTISIAIGAYTIFYAFNSFPDVVKEYPEFFKSIDAVVILISVYLSVFIWNIYRLAKLEFDIISQS